MCIIKTGKRDHSFSGQALKAEPEPEPTCGELQGDRFRTQCKDNFLLAIVDQKWDDQPCSVRCSERGEKNKKHTSCPCLRSLSSDLHPSLLKAQETGHTLFPEVCTVGWHHPPLSFLLPSLCSSFDTHSPFQ